MPTTPTTFAMSAAPADDPSAGPRLPRPQLPRPQLPGPRPASRWRWARVPRSVVGGGLLAAVLAVGTGVGAAAATTAPSSSSTPGPGLGGTKPTAMGTITTVGSGSITVKTRQGQSEVVTYTSSTTITNVGSSGPATLRVGEMVAVQGTTSDNTVAATSIQILPKRGTGKGRPPGSGKGGRPPKGATPPAGGEGGQPLSGGTPPAA